MHLSIRLQLVYDQLLQNEDVWDFCCDHGYLGGAAYKSQNFKNVYFVDPVPSIMNSLKQRFQTFVYREENKSQAYFLVQKGEDVTLPVHGTVSIIGVGGLTICEILNGLAENNVLQARRLVLGPHRDSEKLVEMIEKNDRLKNFKLTEKKDVVENGRKRDFYIFDVIS